MHGETASNNCKSCPEHCSEDKRVETASYGDIVGLGSKWPPTGNERRPSPAPKNIDKEEGTSSGIKKRTEVTKPAFDI